MIKVYVDGACKGNPGIGGWGVYLEFETFNESFYGGELNTTNNRMELKAASEALIYLSSFHHNTERITIYSDSMYLIDGMTKYIFNWAKNNWKTSQKQPVKHADLWKSLHADSQYFIHKIKWHWIKGHSGNLGNDMADKLANLGVQEINLTL